MLKRVKKTWKPIFVDNESMNKQTSQEGGSPDTTYEQWGVEAWCCREASARAKELAEEPLG